MKTLMDVGEAVGSRRQALGLTQALVAQQAGITRESLSRFERGRSAEFGTRKLLAVLAVLGMELEIVATGLSGNLDELRRERSLAGIASGDSRT